VKIATLRRAAWWSAAAALAAALAVHLTLVVFHVLPSNRVSTRLRTATSAWVVPRFAQDWRLFAPVPVMDDYTAYARGFDGGGGATEWLDFTTPEIEAVRRNRLSGRRAVLTTLLTALYDVASRVGPRDGLLRERIVTAWSDVATQPASVVVLEASGSAALTAAHPEATFREMQVMVGIAPPPRFGGSDTERPPAQRVVLPRVPFQQVAAWR
jgi:hypothetical protein